MTYMPLLKLFKNATELPGKLRSRMGENIYNSLCQHFSALRSISMTVGTFEKVLPWEEKSAEVKDNNLLFCKKNVHYRRRMEMDSKFFV